MSVIQAHAGSAHHWLPDEKDMFVPGRLESEDDKGTCTYTVVSDGRTVHVKKKEVGPLVSDLECVNSAIADMVKMPEVNDATIL